MKYPALVVDPSVVYISRMSCELGDGSLVDGSLVDGSLVDSELIDGSLVAGSLDMSNRNCS